MESSGNFIFNKQSSVDAISRLSAHDSTEIRWLIAEGDHAGMLSLISLPANGNPPEKKFSC